MSFKLSKYVNWSIRIHSLYETCLGPKNQQLSIVCIFEGTRGLWTKRGEQWWRERGQAENEKKNHELKKIEIANACLIVVLVFSF